MATSLKNFDNDLSTTYEAALKSGELIFTTSETIKSKETEFDIECQICYAPSLAKKPQGILPVVEHVEPSSTPLLKAIERSNPFLPHSPALFVTDVGEEHKVLLNKFCIVPRHYLVVTKEFQRQTQPLSPDDLIAVWDTLKALKSSEDAVAFFNCGSNSGASQPHKHMQIIPLETPSPISTLVREYTARRPGRKATLTGDIFSLPFNCINHVMLLESTHGTGKSQEEILVAAYISLMDAMIMSIREYAEQNSSDQDQGPATNVGSSFDYNWILTTEFMMMVPRKQEGSKPVNGISLNINSLGFAGMVLAKTPEELKLAQEKGVIEIVSETGFYFGLDGRGRTEEEEQKRKAEQAIVEKQIGGALTNL
ncbi:bifunctional AP-4-A phosphorylase/ADP sulfurylase [Entomortierella lignicola]|nr:bifunctional AP-4-A phosphorylase/ADP sulfurylase [Entomortierella lignicola]